MPAEEDSPDETGFAALDCMRKCEFGLRQRLRVLQVARLKDWKVAFNLAKLQAGEQTSDPMLQQAIKITEDERKEKESKSPSSKMKRGRSGSASSRGRNARNFNAGRQWFSQQVKIFTEI